MAIQQNPSCEPHSQSFEGIGSRVRPLNRIVGSNKFDANPLLTSHSGQVISRNDMGNITLANERMDGFTDLLEDRIITKGKHTTGLDGSVGSDKMDVNSLLSSGSAQVITRNDLDGISLSNERRDHNNRLQKIDASSSSFIGNNMMDVNYLLNSGSSQVKPQYDMGSISISKERGDSASGLQEELIRTKRKHNLNIQEELRMGRKSSSIEINTSGIPMTGVLLNSSYNSQQPLENVTGEQLPSLNEILALPGAVYHELPLPEWFGSCPIAWSQLPSSNKAIGSTPCPTQWGQLPSSSEVPSLSWTVNNKCPLPVESDSYPVTQCIGDHPLKTCCTRRANVLFPGSSLDHSDILADGFPGPDAGTRLEPTESSGGTLLSLDVLYNTPQLELQVGKIPSLIGFPKCAALVTADGKRDKSGDDEAHKGDFNPVNRVASTVLPARKNVSSKSEIGDGILRQARSGRCSKRSQAHLSFVKELDHGETSRPPKSQRSCSNKNESKIGHPSKMLHCKTYGHPDKSNADKQELIAAANAAWNANCAACSSSFWKTVEPIFSFADLKDINYVMQQDVDGCAEMPWPKGSFSTELQGSRRNKDNSDKDVDSVLSDTAEDDRKESVHRKPESKVESAFDNQKCTAAINFGSLNAQNLVLGDDLGHESITSEHSANVLSQNLPRTSSDCLQNLHADLSAVSSGNEVMLLNEKVLMEQYGIDIHSETRAQSEDEDSEIDKDLAELKLRLYEQVNYRRRQWDKIEKAMQNAKEIEDRNLEQLALHKLVEIAYKKLMYGRRTPGSIHNMGARDFSKHNAMAFAKRTLARCKEFEETGKSCFREPALREILFSAPPHCSNVSHVALDKGQALGSVGNGLSDKCQRGSLDLCQSSSSAQVKLLSGNTAQHLSRNLEEDELLLDAVDSMEILDIADGLGAPGQDIGTWLNIDEDLLDNDEELVGLDVPMDDLSELDVIF